MSMAVLLSIHRLISCISTPVLSSRPVDVAWQTAELSTVFTSSSNHGSATCAVANHQSRAPAAETAGPARAGKSDFDQLLWSVAVRWAVYQCRWLVSYCVDAVLAVNEQRWWGCCWPAMRWMRIITSFLRPCYKGCLTLLLHVTARFARFRLRVCICIS